MKTLIIIAIGFIAILNPTYSECVHSRTVSGDELLNLKNVYVEIGEKYVHRRDIQKINKSQTYLIQEEHKVQESNDGSFLPYYSYERLLSFLKVVKPKLEAKGYQLIKIGKSLKGRDLFSIGPKNIESSKKLVLMYGRHHGDEGTANWIIEGFVEKILSTDWLNEYQLVLYPMVNPDGAEAKTRYNSNGRDLNRVWNVEPSRSHDEVQIIQRHLKSIVLGKGIKPVVALDMHGSFTEDFIYRVKKSFRNTDYFNLQGTFIETLSQRDQFQAGNFQLSNGDSKMARIYLVREFGINALTHETPREIRSNSGRNLEDLKSQGVAIAHSIEELY